jgi:hypothetical protein
MCNCWMHGLSICGPNLFNCVELWSLEAGLLATAVQLRFSSLLNSFSTPKRLNSSQGLGPGAQYLLLGRCDAQESLSSLDLVLKAVLCRGK